MTGIRPQTQERGARRHPSRSIPNPVAAASLPPQLLQDVYEDEQS